MSTRRDIRTGFRERDYGKPISVREKIALRRTARAFGNRIHVRSDVQKVEDRPIWLLSTTARIEGVKRRLLNTRSTIGLHLRGFPVSFDGLRRQAEYVQRKHQEALLRTFGIRAFASVQAIVLPTPPEP